MSIAASLATLRREGHAIPQNPPNVKLTHLTATSSLSERAASARNALTLLSTADPSLPTFEHQLHLSDTSFDRATLSTDSQNALRLAVARLALRLTPVFLTRPCTALLEWLLQTLQLPNLGSANEIDALMLSALPFHHTEQFLVVARTLLRSPNAKTWRWLVKRIKPGRLVDTQFCVENAPLHVFKLIITRAVECVNEGVAVAPLAALVANFVGRRMVSDDRPMLAVLCVDALLALRGAINSAEHLLCALFTALAAAVSYGLELQVVQTIASVAAQLLSGSNTTLATRDTAVALLALCLRRHDKCLSSKHARILLKTDKLPVALPCLGPSQSVDTYKGIIICAITDAAPSERLLRVVGKAMEAEQLLSVDSTSKLVEYLLESCTKATDDDSEKFAEERTALLGSLLAALFKGKFSVAVDDVLHHHLFSRKDGKKHKKKLRIVDAAVSKALDAVISGKMGDKMLNAADESYPLVVDILCLSHPDKKRRRNALESIGRRDLVTEEKNEMDLRRLDARLQSIIASERDLHLVSMALENVIRLPAHMISTNVIRTTLLRCSSEGVKGPEHYPERDKLAISLLGLCEKFSGEQFLIAPAIILLLLLEGLLERCYQIDEGRERIQRLRGRFGNANGSNSEGTDSDSLSLVKDVKEDIAQMFLSQTEHFNNLFSIVTGICPKWIDELAGMWLKLLWGRLSCAGNSDELSILLQRMLSLVQLHPQVADVLIRTFEEDVNTILGTAEAPRPEIAVFVWNIVSELINSPSNWDYQEKVLRKLSNVLGLSQTIDILKNGIFNPARSHEAHKRNLEWYMNFCLVHPDIEIGKEAVVTISRIAYGDDSKLRIALDEIWSRRSVLNRKKREKKCILWDFLQLLSNLLEHPALIDIKDTDAKLIYTEMQDMVRGMTSGGGNIRAPLHKASFGVRHRSTIENHLASILLGKTQVEVDDLYLLRALGRKSFPGRSDRSKLYSLLESTLRQLNDSGYSMFAVEVICRLAMLIVISGKLSDPELDVQRLANTIMSTFKSIQVSGSDSQQKRALVTALLCLIGFMTSISMPKDFPEKDKLVEFLLAHSILSTSTGACAQRITNALLGESISGDQLLHYLKNLIIPRERKSRRSLRTVPSARSDEAELSTRAALGAVRAIHQLAGRSGNETEKVNLSWLQSSVGELWKFIAATQESDEDRYTNPETRDPEHLAATLNTLATLHYAISMKDVAQGRDAAMKADFDALISMAFAKQTTDAIADPAMKEMQSVAHNLVAALITSQESGSKHVLPKLLQSQTFMGQASLITKLLEHIAPALISEGSDLPKIAKIVADAAYNESSKLPRKARMNIMQTLVTGRNPAIEAFDVTKNCLLEIYNRENQISSPSIAAKECSLFLQEAHLSCEEDIDSMIYLERDVNCRISCVHFINPGFIAKLGSLSDHDREARNVSSADERLSRLFVVLLELSASAEKDSAIHLLLASIPISTMQLCACAALEAELFSLRIESLRYLAERTETGSLPLFPTWQSISDGSTTSTKMREDVESSFLEIVGSKICEAIKTNGASPEAIEIREVATDALKSLVQRVGSSSFAVVQEFASRICCVSTADSEVIRSLTNESGRSLILRGKVLECVASFTSTLGKYSLPFVPYLLESSFAILEKYCDPEQQGLPEAKEKNYKAYIFIIAASVNAISSILSRCPMFFGGKALKRLVLLALETEVDAPREVLEELAAPKVPVDVFVSVFGNFATVDDEYLKKARIDGLLGLVKSISSGVGRMYKSEIKVNWQRILNVLLRSIDCGRDVSILFAGEEDVEMEPKLVASQENCSVLTLQSRVEQNARRLEKCDELDTACGEVLVKIVLKLSESEFELVFKALVQWFDGGFLPDAIVTACEDLGVEVEKNLPRAVAFFAMIQKLVSVLKIIMMPYFVQLMTRLTTIIGRKIAKPATSNPVSNTKTKGRPRKRNRGTMDDSEVCMVLVSQQTSLRETCLTLVASFFSLDSKDSMMNTRLVGELQEALLSAFDDLEGQSESVSKALQGLARRMILPGITSDTKKNQDMLIGLVRQVLSRTRDANPKLRAGALNTCRDMAMAVGDEFLATLPESMPILAEVIDDEESTVAKAAERYVLFVESMAGEPILQQLK